MKFGDCLKNKNFVSQTNELLCKLIAYNITVLISAIYELGINPDLPPIMSLANLPLDY